MKGIYYLKQVAAVYDCGTYGAGSYSDGEECLTTSASGQSLLPSTGTSVAVGIVGGVLLIAVAIVILFKMRKKQKNSR